MAAHQKNNGVALVDSPSGNALIEALAKNELADGQMNNSTAKFFTQAFANAYGLNAPEVTAQVINNDTAQQLRQQRTTPEKLAEFTQKTIDNFIRGAANGLNRGAGAALKALHENPIAAGTSLAGLASAGVCPYLSGLGSVPQTVHQLKNASETSAQTLEQVKQNIGMSNASKSDWF